MDYTIKDLPKEERPRERLKDKGVAALTDVELVSIVLRAGTSGKNVKELSGQILNSYSLAEISDVPIDSLERIDGISEVKAGQLKAVSELGKRIQREERSKIENFSQLKSAVSDMRLESEEKIRLIILSSSNEVIDIYERQGDVKSVKFELKDILNKVISRNAAGFILVHNHPSGNPEPTQEDIKSTKSLLKASDLLEISFLDHVIVGKQIKSMKNCTDIEF